MSRVGGAVLWLVLWGCVRPADPVCDNGLDEDGDGICDRDVVDWSADAVVEPGTDRANLYGLAADDLAKVRARGERHAFVWPVEVTGLLLPYRPLNDLLASDSGVAGDFTRQALGYGSFEEMYDWLGLARFPEEPGAGPYALVPPEGMAVGDAIGAGRIETEYGEALTFSCGACHVGELFGRPVMGLPNRRTRANEFFHNAAGFFPKLDPVVFQTLTGANDDEMVLFERTAANLPAVGSKIPAYRGLDTSLAQVALSLARRDDDPWATRSEAYEATPRANGLDVLVADSEPAPWWNLKYKTRWLSDASIRSGNPIFTNFLWNELGRGTDLHELGDWLDHNGELVDELTVAVFASEPPRWTDYFDASTLDRTSAERGEALFVDHCAECHGQYEKDWDQGFETTAVVYHPQTPTFDVGTDPQRAEGMVHFASALNGLAISKEAGAVVAVQEGYVPPPLVGIWARWPYLHHGTVPTLCDLLSPEADRPASFWVGPADDPTTDFDAGCVGYPVGDAAPLSWKDDPAALVDTTLPGLSNRGHAERFTDPDGAWIFSEADVADLVMFLKTL